MGQRGAYATPTRIGSSGASKPSKGPSLVLPVAGYAALPWSVRSGSVRAWCHPCVHLHVYVCVCMCLSPSLRGRVQPAACWTGSPGPWAVCAFSCGSAVFPEVSVAVGPLHRGLLTSALQPSPLCGRHPAPLLHDCCSLPHSPIVLTVAKCWDPSPQAYFTLPRSECCRGRRRGSWVRASRQQEGVEEWGGMGQGWHGSSGETVITGASLSQMSPSSPSTPLLGCPTPLR